MKRYRAVVLDRHSPLSYRTGAPVFGNDCRSAWAEGESDDSISDACAEAVCQFNDEAAAYRARQTKKRNALTEILATNFYHISHTADGNGFIIIPKRNNEVND